MDETRVTTSFTRPSIAAVGSVATPTVRDYLPGFAARVLTAPAEERNLAALHLLWLYGEFAAVKRILRAWRRELIARPSELLDEDFLDGFEDQHPMPDADTTGTNPVTAAPETTWLVPPHGGAGGGGGPW